jgi:phosphoglycerol transferase MdoB-like AlkP superfamily enzyme
LSAERSDILIDALSTSLRILDLRSAMTVINGLPAHILLVHFVVVLVPLTALLLLLCALWPPARRHLVWFTLVLAAVTAALTPLTIRAGEWLIGLIRNPPQMLNEHADRAESMTYFSVALLMVAMAVAVLHVLERRCDKRRLAIRIVVAIVALAVGIASMIQVYRVGDTGSQSVWGGQVDRLEKAEGTR